MSADASVLLEVRGLLLRRGGARVLELPTLHLPERGSLALAGPNGSGKSSLLLALAALLVPASGELRFRGEALRTEAQRLAYRRRVATVFQDPLLFEGTVAHNLESGLRLRGIPRGERRQRVAAAAERFGISHLLSRSARRLSGGEARRTSLARALVLDPEILFLDEPFTALDPPTREGLLEDLARALAEARTALVLATHDQEEALRLADELMVLKGGRIVQVGPAAEVFNRPVDAAVAAFLGMETILEGPVLRAQEGLFVVGVGGRELEAVGPAWAGHCVRVGIRPENVTLLGPSPVVSSARNAFPGTVLRIVPKGPFLKVDLDCGFSLSAFVTRRSLEELHLEPGSPVTAAFKATAVHLLRH